MSILQKVKMSGGNDTAELIVVHGKPGVGKTTLALSSPNPIFMCTEDGLGDRTVPMADITGGYSAIMENIQALTTEPHDFKTLVLDSLDWAEPVIWETVCAEKAIPNKNSKASVIEDYPFGAGYKFALDYWRKILGAMIKLRDARNMNIVIIAHSHLQKVRESNVEVGDYEVWNLKVKDSLSNLVTEWAEMVLFADFRMVRITGPDGRDHVVSSDERVLRTCNSSAWLAKNRWGFPKEIDLPNSRGWDKLIWEKGWRKRYTQDLEKLISTLPDGKREESMAWFDTIRNSDVDLRQAWSTKIGAKK